jgi:hypothetical protein
MNGTIIGLSSINAMGLTLRLVVVFGRQASSRAYGNN